MQPPRFWQHRGLVPALLAPVAAVVAGIAAWRVAQPGVRMPVPVVCCGNATVGGAGKTPLALDLGARLVASGRAVAFLTRGHGGRARGVVRVDPARHDADTVGDEALLLAAIAPVFVAADRVAGARAAVAAGAQVLVMDDGLQNPGLAKDLSFLVIDGGAGFGNGFVLPAGPLREPVAAAAARCQAAVLIGDDRFQSAARLPPTLPVLRARLVTDSVERRVVAFAGIGRPEKFFESLRAAGADLADSWAFADHHRYSASDLRGLQARADACGAPLITTTKDAVRLPEAVRARVLVAKVRLQWAEPGAVQRLLDALP